MPSEVVRLSVATPDEIRGWSSGEIRTADELLADRAGLRHVELAVPVVHPLFLRGRRCPIARLLGWTREALYRVVYIQGYVVSEPGDTPLHAGQFLDVDAYDMLRAQYGDGFAIEIGPAAIRAPLRAAGHEALLLDALPLLPVSPDCDIGQHYRRIVMRNTRLRKLLALSAPLVVVRCEVRQLQLAVDALFDNAALRYPVRDYPSNRRLTSLVDRRGLRTNPLSKRVDFSARTVVVPGPELLLHQCGLPVCLALELFQPFVLRALVERGEANTPEAAWQLLARRDPCVRDALEDAVRGRLVLVNRPGRAIQAFEPVLIEGKALQLSPLLCRAMHTTFAGEEVVVHLPLSTEAQVEGQVLFLATLEQHGELSREIVLGCYHLTEDAGQPGRAFAGTQEVLLAHACGAVGSHDAIRVRPIGATTVGRVLFNDALPAGLPFYNEPMTSKTLACVVADCRARFGPSATADLLDRLKRVGLRAATRAGTSLGMTDLRAPASKPALLAAAEREVAKLRRQESTGMISPSERQRNTFDVWTHTRSRLGERLAEAAGALVRLARCGASGGIEQLRQLAGMGGLVIKSNGAVLEVPITSSLGEGRSVPEYALVVLTLRSTEFARQLREGTARRLTRELVRAYEDVIVTRHDCGTARRGPLTCEAARGVCQLCYGSDTAGQFAEIGTAVGVRAALAVGGIAAQAILRTYSYGRTLEAWSRLGGLLRLVRLFDDCTRPALERLQDLRQLLAEQHVSLDDRHLEVLVRPRRQQTFLTRLLGANVRRVLVSAALHGEVDPVDTPSARAILGRLIPVGTGFQGET